MNLPSGIVLIDKPQDITSFQALDTVKKKLGTGKVGHTGTLDRFASGLLVVCTGKFTKLAPYITGQDKEYEAVFRFGEETDTLDPEGGVTRRMPLPETEKINRSIGRFTGTIMQKPPKFSAVHIGGKRAYRLARQGQDVDIPAREVRVNSITVTDWTPPDLACRIVCSKGTYIRSLGADIAADAGSCAFTAALRRTRVGSFSVSSARAPEHFSPEQDLITGKACFDPLPDIGIAEVRREYSRHIGAGKPLTDSLFTSPPEGEGILALFDDAGTFLALTEKKAGTIRYIFVMNGL